MDEIRYIPDTMAVVTPHMVIEDCAKAMQWYTQVFDAIEVMRMEGPGGKIMHAHMTIGGAHVMMVDAFPEWGSAGPQGLGGTSVVMHIYTPDTDALFQKAVDAGAEALMSPEDAFWGDRFAKVKDPFGHHWSFATHQRDVSPEEMEKAMAEWQAENAGQ